MTWDQELFNIVLSVMVYGGPVLGRTAVTLCMLNQTQSELNKAIVEPLFQTKLQEGAGAMTVINMTESPK
jgi:hypothetical protein